MAIEEKPQISSGMQIFLLIFFIIAALSVMAGLLFFLVRPLFGEFDFEEPEIKDVTSAFLSVFLSQLSLFVLAFVVFIRIIGSKIRVEIRISPFSFKNLGIILLVFVGCIFVSEGLTMLNSYLIEQFPQSGFLEQQAEQTELYRVWFDPKRAELFVPALVLFALMPAVVEELIFRGLLLKKLNEVSNGKTHFAVIVSALFFAAVHMQPWNLLPMVALGVIFGYVYVYTKDIRYSILLHFMFNALQITAAFFFAEQVPV